MGRPHGNRSTARCKIFEAQEKIECLFGDGGLRQACRVTALRELAGEVHPIELECTGDFTPEALVPTPSPSHSPERDAAAAQRYCKGWFQRFLRRALAILIGKRGRSAVN